MTIILNSRRLLGFRIENAHVTFAKKGGKTGAATGLKGGKRAASYN